MKKKRTLIFLTVFNVVLFILSLLGYFGTKENVEIFNSTGNAFDYEERGEGKVDLTLNEGKRVTIVFHKTNAEVVGAYRFDDRPDVVRIVRFIRYYCGKNGVEITRTNSDLWGEIKLHTVLYAVGYKRAQTENANIDFNKDERWYVNAVGSVFGWLGI